MILTRPPLILALDVAQRTGWAHSSGASGWFDLPKGDARLDALDAAIASLVDEHGCDTLVTEDSAQGAKSWIVVQVHAEYRSVIKRVASRLGVALLIYPLATWKAWLTRKPAAKKDLVARCVEMQFGRRIDDDNECDAFAILKCAEAGVLPPAQRKKRERQIWKESEAKQRKLFGCK